MRYLKVNMSSGDPISITDDELKTVLEGISKRSPAVLCRNGAFNAAFYVSITVDTKKMNDIAETRRLGVEEPKGNIFMEILKGDTIKKLP